MKCLITGISGFLAGYIAGCFKEQGYEIIGIHHSLQRPKERADRMYRVHLPDEDIYDVIAMEQPDVVIHAAGTASVPYSMQQPYEDFSISVPATAIVLDAMKEHAPEATFVFLSSAAVYGDPEELPIKETTDVAPISPYGYHKKMGEDLCLEYHRIFNLCTKVARIFSAYGAGLEKQVVYDTIRKFQEDEVVQMYGTGEESRDFIHAKDIARGLFAIAQDSGSEVVYNLASGMEISIAELCTRIADLTNSEKPVRFDGQREPGKPVNWKADISKISSIGFKSAVTLSDGLSSVIDAIISDA